MKHILKLSAVILACFAGHYGCSDESDNESLTHHQASKTGVFEEAKVLLKTARKYYEVGDIVPAISSIDQAVMISDGLRYTIQINNIQEKAIMLYAEFGDFDKVFSLKNKYPNIRMCEFCVVRYAVEQNNLEIAMKITRQLLTLWQDDWVKAHALIAGEYARTHQLDKANEILSKFFYAKDKAKIMTEMIEGQANIGKIKQAEILLGELKYVTRSLPYLSTWPYIHASRYWIAEALIKQGDIDRAYELINKMRMHISKHKISSWKIEGLILVVEEKSKQGDFNEAVEILRTGVNSLHDEMIDEGELYSGAVASLVTHRGNEYAEEIINDVKAIKDPMVKAYYLLSIAEAYPNNDDIAAVESLLDSAVNTALGINQNDSRDHAYFKPLILIDSSDLYFEKGLKEKALNGLKLAHLMNKTEYQQKDYNDVYSKITGTPEKQLAPVPIWGSYGETKRHTPDSVAKEYGFKGVKDFKKWYDEL